MVCILNCVRDMLVPFLLFLSCLTPSYIPPFGPGFKGCLISPESRGCAEGKRKISRQVTY